MHANIASCMMLWVAEHVVHCWGGLSLYCPARCSSAGLQKTLHQSAESAVVVIGNMLRGPAQLAVAWLGTQQSALHNNQPGGISSPLELGWSLLEVE
jgi:hypothetical protein